MNGPLLISLLPPGQGWDAAAPDPASASIIMIVFLLAGSLLAYLLREIRR